jgi:hypothetical protein
VPLGSVRITVNLPLLISCLTMVWSPCISLSSCRRSSELGSGDDSPAGSSSHGVSSDVHPRSVEPGHLDDFKHQVERKQREVSELVLDIRIKG